MCHSGNNKHLGKPTECGFVRSFSASKRENAWLNIGQEEHVWEITTWGKQMWLSVLFSEITVSCHSHCLPYLTKGGSEVRGS